jgi:hypothetical protein
MKGSKYDKCKFPACDGSVTRNPQVGLCNKHSDMLEFIMWALDNIKVEAAECMDGIDLGENQ